MSDDWKTIPFPAGVADKTIEKLRSICSKIQKNPSETRYHKFSKDKVATVIDEVDHDRFFDVLQQMGFLQMREGVSTYFLMPAEDAHFIKVEDGLLKRKFSRGIQIMTLPFDEAFDEDDDHKHTPRLQNPESGSQAEPEELPQIEITTLDGAGSLDQPTMIRTASAPNKQYKDRIMSKVENSLSTFHTIVERYGIPAFLFAKGAPIFRFPSEFPFSHDPYDQHELDGAFSSWISDTLLDKATQERMEATRTLNTAEAGSRLRVMKTEGDGNSLCHAATLALWGVHDRGCILRNCLSVLMQTLQQQFLDRFRQVHDRESPPLSTFAEYAREYRDLASMPEKKQVNLRPIHVFALANALRRPIIVYGQVQADRPLTGMAGIYLPVYCTHSCSNPECDMNYSKRPLMLAYSSNDQNTGKFSALVVMEGEHPNPSLLPLHEKDGAGHVSALPIRFLKNDEVGQDKLKKYLEMYFDLQSLADGSMFARLDANPDEDTKRLQAGLWTNYIDKARVVFCQQKGVEPPPVPEPSSHRSEMEGSQNSAMNLLQLLGTALQQREQVQAQSIGDLFGASSLGDDGQDSADALEQALLEKALRMSMEETSGNGDSTEDPSDLTSVLYRGMMDRRF